MTTGNIFIGMSGWTFEGWRGSFYPEGLKQKAELAYASRRVRSIEVNGTFYSLLRPHVYRGWYEETAADFVFTLKGPKYITHERRLREFERPLSNFIASGILALREKLGPILWQFPPNMAFDQERFEPFLAALPRDTLAAALLGRNCSDWMQERAYLEVDHSRPLRHAIEGRHPSFRCREFVELARKYDVAIVVGDTDGRWPYMEDLTSDFVYLRLHGDASLHPRGYAKAALERWAARFQTWSDGGQPEDAALVLNAPVPERPRDVFAYFDNEVKETAALNALSISGLLTQQGRIPDRTALLALVSEVKPKVRALKANSDAESVRTQTKPKKKATGHQKAKAKTKAKSKPKALPKTKKKAPAKQSASKKVKKLPRSA